MRILVRQTKLNGKLQLPCSKSQFMRAVAFAALASGESYIRGYLASNDTELYIAQMRKIGADIQRDKDDLRIVGVSGKPNSSGSIEVGNSGIALRFLSAISALSYTPTVVTGDASIQQQRDCSVLAKAIIDLGGKAYFLDRKGFAPIRIQGPVEPNEIVMDGQDSQPVSAILILAAMLQGTTRIRVINPGETDFVLMTLKWLSKMGVQIKHENFTDYLITGSVWDGFQYQVQPDLSTLAFVVGMALVSKSRICVDGFSWDSQQGDGKLFKQLKPMLIDYHEEKHQLVINGDQTLNAFDIDVRPFIDAVPILTVLACYADDVSYIRHANMARFKETDRLSVMQKELRKMGANIQIENSTLRIEPSKLKPAMVDSHGDHRVALALMVAAMGIGDHTIINGFECHQKTYPNILSDIQVLKGDVCIASH